MGEDGEGLVAAEQLVHNLRKIWVSVRGVATGLRGCGWLTRTAGMVKATTLGPEEEPLVTDSVLAEGSLITDDILAEESRPVQARWVQQSNDGW